MPWASKLRPDRLSTMISEEICEDAVFDRTRRVSEFGATTNVRDFDLLSCSGCGVCAKSKCV
jgi:hypothetical protein